MPDDETSTPEPATASRPKAGLGQTIFVTLPRALIAALILGGIAINFANVVSRHIFSAAIFWAEEILVFLVIWFVSIAVAAVTYQGAHLKMDLLSTRIPSPWKQIINATMIVCFIIFCALVVTQSFDVVSAFRRTGMVSITASIPLVIPHAALLIGFSLMVLAVIARIGSHLSGKF
jgi:TRAP-type C4-dicarboxylate transport system permease small subunit